MEEDDQCRDPSHTVEFAKVGEGMGLGYGGSSHLLDLFDHGRECGGINNGFQPVSLRDSLYPSALRNLPTIGTVQQFADSSARAPHLVISPHSHVRRLVFNPSDRFVPHHFFSDASN